MSLGGRLTLFSVILYVIPLYSFSIYRAPRKIITRIDSIRNRFLWQGADTSKKKHTLVNWSKDCIEKKT